jgi:hypothetical protein
MGSLIALPLTAAIIAMAAYISILFGFFLASLAAIATSMTGLIALVLLI